MANLIDAVDKAAQAHGQLRALHCQDELAKARRVRTILQVLDRTQEEIPSTGALLERIRIDAEYYAGRSDTAGFRDPEELWNAYEELREAVSGRRCQ